MTPFRNEKNSNWEGAYRVPAMVRWPGKIKPGTVSNEIISHLDWMPTLVATAGVPDVKEKLLAGTQFGDARPTRCISTATICCPTSPASSRNRRAIEFLLFLRRGRPRRPALRQLEIRLRHPAGRGNAGGVAEGVRAPARAVYLQPAHGPVRTRADHLEHLLRLAARPRLHAGARRRRWSASSWRRSRSFRRGRRRPASRLARLWKR